MTNKKMINLLQKFFDGHVLSPFEVTDYTSIPPGDAEEVYEAIKKLRNIKLSARTEMPVEDRDTNAPTWEDHNWCNYPNN